MKVEHLRNIGRNWKKITQAWVLLCLSDRLFNIGCGIRLNSSWHFYRIVIKNWIWYIWKWHWNIKYFYLIICYKISITDNKNLEPTVKKKWTLKCNQNYLSETGCRRVEWEKRMLRKWSVGVLSDKALLSQR